MLKQFITQQGGIDEYAEVKVKLFPGRAPEFVMGDKRTDLTKFKTVEGLRRFLDSMGLVRRLPTFHCRNTDPSCQLWALHGECGLNSAYMSQSCAFACRTCDREL